MMHTRHLVRRLLGFRRSFKRALNRGLYGGGGAQWQPDAADNSYLGLITEVAHPSPEAEKHNAVVHDKLKQSISPEDLNGYLLNYVEASAACRELLATANRNLVGHSLLPKDLDQKTGTIDLLKSSEAA